MKRFGKNTGRALALSASAALLAAVVASGVASGASTTVRAGNLIVKLGGSVKPKALPKRKFAPITLNVEGRISTSDKSHVPAVRILELDFDKNGTLFTKGLPTCTVGKLRNTLTPQALRACRSALVGRGKVTAEVQFPDQAPIPAKGDLLIFNGKPKGRKPVVITHSFVTEPVSTTFVVAGTVKKTKGKYGTNVKFVIPPIASGQGSLTSFKAKIKRTWRFKRKKRSYLIARCANGRFQAHGDLRFVNGTRLQGTVLETCRRKG